MLFTENSVIFSGISDFSHSPDQKHEKTKEGNYRNGYGNKKINPLFGNPKSKFSKKEPVVSSPR